VPMKTMRIEIRPYVMAGLVPAIHVLTVGSKFVDARHFGRA
jgi:hypothetical protein